MFPRRRPDDAIQLIPPREMTLEFALEFIEDDELVEVTPKSIRLRKKILNDQERKVAAKKPATVYRVKALKIDSQRETGISPIGEPSGLIALAMKHRPGLILGDVVLLGGYVARPNSVLDSETQRS